MLLLLLEVASDAAALPLPALVHVGPSCSAVNRRLCSRLPAAFLMLVLLSVPHCYL